MIQKKWIGIDVSKEKLDIFIAPDNEHSQITYDKKSVGKFIERIVQLSHCLVVLEATGGLERELVKSLSGAGLDFCVLNPRLVRNFARAEGILAKTDIIDAKILSQYAYKLNPRPREIGDNNTMELKKLCCRRNQLQEMIKAEKQRLHRTDREMVIYIKKHITYMTKQLKSINKKMSDKINADKDIKKKVEIIKSIPGVSDNTAFVLMADLSELGKLNRCEIASLVGVAPFNRDSGKMRGKRSIWGGRFDVRCALYMAALASIRHNEIINCFYKRLRSEGKVAKVAIVACMRKLLVILNTMVKNGSFWNPDEKLIVPGTN